MNASVPATTSWKDGWFKFTTRDLTWMAVLIAITGVFQYLWSHFVFGIGVLGPFAQLFSSYGFNIAAFVVLYFVPKPGAATVVKFFGAIIEVLLGNPFGPIAIFYGTAEGVGVDLAYVLFKRRLSLQMIIWGSVFAWLIAAPVDAYRDAVPMTLDGIVSYFGPGLIGKIWISWLCYLTLIGMRRVGIQPAPETVIVTTETALD